MPKYKLSIEEERELDPFDFEHYCSACDNFNTDDCPFKGKVNEDTEWKLIGCKEFWD